MLVNYDSFMIKSGKKILIKYENVISWPHDLISEYPTKFHYVHIHLSPYLFSNIPSLILLL